MIIMKFGGTSVADAQAMKQAAEIVVNAQEPVLAVLSACSGITNKLVEVAKQSVHISDADRNSLIDEIIQYHQSVANDLKLQDDQVQETILKLGEDLRSFCEGISILGECTKRSYDKAASFGELLSTVIFNAFLSKNGNQSSWFDARDCMKTNSDFMKAVVDEQLLSDAVNEKLIPQFEKHIIIITQGFIGSDAEDSTTTLGRGGSDYSAALFGASLQADSIIIWTDVSGIASADPRIIPDAFFIPSMSFDEARMLSFFGAKVLHPETILPALDKDIPVYVKNTFRPMDAGTKLTRKGDPTQKGMRSVIGKNNVSLIKIRSLKHGEADIETVNRFLASLPGIVLLSGGIEHSLYAIVDCLEVEIRKHVDVMREHSIEIKEGTLISAVGPNFHAASSEAAIKGFYEIVFQCESHPVFISGLQSNTLNAFIQTKNALPILQKLHGLCS